VGERVSLPYEAFVHRANDDYATPAAICYVAQVMSATTNRQRRVVISGIGVVCPLGSSPSEVWSALEAGRSGVVNSQTIPGSSAGSPMRYAGECQQFTGDISNFGELDKSQKKAVRKALKVMCRETQMAVAAAGMAVADAGFGEGELDPERSGVVLGSDYMLTMPEDYVDGINTCTKDEQFDFGDWGAEGLNEMTPLWMLKYLPNMPASHIAILHDLRGPNNSLTLREAASNMAIGEAFRTVARGHADMMLAGATGTRILPLQAIHAMQTEELASIDCDPAAASRPFDRDRTGMVAGEGAGVVVLEERSAAEARGATIYGELLGLGSSSVANRQLIGDCRQALANALRAALVDSGLAPAGIGHINAHGLATRQRDVDEAQALAEALGDASLKVPVTAMKSYFGNLGAGSGVVELIGSLLALKHNRLPRVLNYEAPDPQCPLRIAAGETVAGASFLNLNITPQGQAAVLAVSTG
jgi:3-oxoacyl-[acyl-carrier-protein] synthase II